jgi:hypothetical protein
MGNNEAVSVHDIGPLVLDTALPIWPLPLSSTVNPLVDRAAECTSNWQKEFDLTAQGTAWKPLAELQPTLLAAQAFPRADLDTLTLASEWLAWFFHVDDLFDEGAAGAKTQLARLVTETLRGLIHSLRIPDDEDSAVPRAMMEALLDLLLRTRQVMSPVQFQMFVHHVNCYTEVLTAEAVNRETRTVPDLDSYCALRRDTGPFFPFIDLVEHAEAVRLPNDFYGTGEYERLLTITADISGYINDFFSVGKEQERQDCHNLLLVLQKANNATIAEAAVMAVKIIVERLGEFNAIAAELPSSFESQKWNETSRAAVACWIGGLRSFLCHSAWYIGHDRYRAAGNGNR